MPEILILILNHLDKKSFFLINFFPPPVKTFFSIFVL